MFFRAKKISTVCLLDIGSSKVCCLIVRFNHDSQQEVLGYGIAPAQGIKAGVIVNLDKATHCISDALSDAEKMAGQEIHSVVVNVTSSSLQSHYLYAQTSIEEGAPITQMDVKKMVDKHLVQFDNPEQEILHQFVLSYTVDDEKGIADPCGQYARKLGAHLHVVTIPESQSRNLVTVLDRCHVSIQAKIATPFAVGLACLTDEEKDLGATVIDLGAGKTGGAVFLNGGLLHVAHLPIGGNLITRDIAQGLSISLPEAERLKTLNGAAFLSHKDRQEMVIISTLGEESKTQIPRSDLIGIMVPRVEEMFEQMMAALDVNPGSVVATRRIVLTGGGAQLQGIKEKATALLDTNVRIAKIRMLKKMPENLEGYTFLTCIGLLEYIMMKHHIHHADVMQIRPEQKGFLGKVSLWLDQNF